MDKLATLTKQNFSSNVNTHNNYNNNNTNNNNNCKAILLSNTTTTTTKLKNSNSAATATNDISNKSPTLATQTAITKTTTITTTTTLNRQRNKLIRTPLSIDNSSVDGQTSQTLDDVMGGGFTSPPPVQQKQQQRQQQQLQQQQQQMHEKLLQQQELQQKLTKIGNAESKTTACGVSGSGSELKQHLLVDVDAATEHEEDTPPQPPHQLAAAPAAEQKGPNDKKTPTKTHKESKFAAKLRRSFRRAEHKSLEIKHPPPASNTTNASSASSAPPQPDNHNFIFSLTNLPGLVAGAGSGCGGHGHINPALLLDSPDESTPPEFNYQALSSVATTNSSTSIESNDFYVGTGDYTTTTNTNTSSLLQSSGSSYQQSPQQQQQQTTAASMGGEVSSTANAKTETGASLPPTAARPKLQKQNSSKSDGGFVTLAAAAVASAASTAAASTSRSCSITSESSSAKLTRLQNFLFKSSGDSSRSYLGHSNDGFTASSHNSSSGEWENLTSFGTYNEPPPPPASNTAISGSDGAAGSYYQYTLTSPNNPFLPEIIARSYHSPYDEEEEDEAEAAALQQQLRHAGDELDELDANVTAVKYGAHAMLRQQRSSPAASTTPLQSRAGSQEGQQPDGSCSGASTPGRQKRKLFSLASPQAAHYQQQQHVLGSSPPSTGMGATVRLLNPFLSASGSPPKSGGIAGESSSSSSFSSHFTRSKNVATSPIAVPQDLNAKREEFLRATMKICLVVSPPSSKLQLKSKSLTHLDGLDSIIAGQHGGTTTKPGLSTQPLPQSHTTPHPFPQASLAPIQPHQYPQRNHHHSHHSHHHTTHQSSHKQRSNNSAARSSRNSTTSNVHATPTIYTPSLRKKHTSSQTPPLALSPTSSTITTSSACNKICCCSNANDIQDISSAVGNTSPLSASHVVFPPFTTVSSNNTLPHFAVQKASLSLQKDIDLVSSSTVATAAVSSVTSTSAHQHTLSPASGFHSATPTGSSAVNFFHYALGQATTATVMGGSGGTPSSHRKKTTFMQRKKPLLTRSEVSSSEYFSVSFCTENGCQEEEFIPATKGVTLYNALNQALRRRNLSFSQIAITDNNLPSFLEAGTTSYTSSLDENTEVENLAGHHLVVTERDGSRKTLQKAASFGSRTRPPRLLSSASTEETTESGDQRAVPGKQLKQRWSGLFGIKNPQQSQLCELLNNYAKMGVPQRTPAALNFDHPDFDAAQEYLDNMHKSWRDFVHCEEMSDSDTRIQTAIWELVTTEVYYIHALQTVTDLFLACLEAVQEEKLLTDVDQHRLFSNVRDICEANLKFWTLHLYPMVAHSVATREPMRIEFFQPGFTTFAATFSPYKKYCAEQSTCQFYCKELNRTNPLFTSYLAWCESQKMCNRLRLADILVRPMQRLTKYSLLLAAIKKHQTDVEEIEAVDNMIHTVENFVCSVNNHLTTRQEHERLKGVMARIESYDVVDTNNELLDKMVKQHSQMFDLCAPMKGCPTHQVRHLFMEGDHKFKDHLGKADVHCFLLTDMLLVCKTIAKKGLGSLKVIRQPYLTDRLMIHHEVKSNTLNCVYLNEFQVAITAFTLQCSEAKNWYESLKRAKLIYTRLKQGGANWDSFRFGGSGASGGTADSLGVKKSPMNSSICSHVTSANNSHSGSVEWNDSRNISVDFEKTNSLSSDEGSMAGSHAAYQLKGKNIATSPHKMKVITSSANTLSVQPVNHLGQSLPNLNLHHNQTNLYHTYSNNTLLVPGTTSSHSGQLLLSPCHRGISYPPPSPTRVPLRRGMAFSASIKSNPPLVKTRNITSQNSINWHQIPATPTPTSPQMSQHNSPSNNSAALMGNNAAAAATAVTSGGISPTATAAVKMQSPLTIAPIPLAIDSTNKNLSNHNLTDVPGSGSGSGSNCQLQFSNETDV